jgi:phospholipase C
LLDGATIMRAWLFIAFIAACSGKNAQAPDGPPVSEPDADTDAGLVLPTPIKYVVVIVKENHTFDNYFTGFPGAESTMTAKLHDGTTITRQRAPDGPLAGDISHSHASAVKDYDNGKMDGFDTIVTADPLRPFIYYAEDQIPNYWQYARHFALFDHFFSTLAGPSSPGHFAIITAQTPHYANSTCNDGTDDCLSGCLDTSGTTQVPTYNPDTCATSTHDACFAVPSVVDALPEGLTWRTYGGGSGTHVGTAFGLVDGIGQDGPVRDAHFGTYTKLMQDLTSGDMANFTHIDVSSAPNGGSEHPPAAPCTGENFTVNIVNAIMQGPHWNETAIIITWDDFGGFYDHVKPPVEKCANGAFFNVGFRLPALVISPYAKNEVIHTVTEQASIPRLVEDLFGMPRMADRDPHARDARAGSMMDAFDFTQPPRDPLVLQTRTCP